MSHIVILMSSQTISSINYALIQYLNNFSSNLYGFYPKKNSYNDKV